MDWKIDDSVTLPQIGFEDMWPETGTIIEVDTETGMCSVLVDEEFREPDDDGIRHVHGGDLTINLPTMQ